MEDITLFSYCIPMDDGAAPNPFWGICTLAICKPVIRRTAQKYDWVVATGSKKYDLQNKVVYAMEVTEDPISLEEYPAYCKKNKLRKTPNLKSKELKDRAGDCIYYEENKKLKLLKGMVHNKKDNYKIDTEGKNVLLSKHFYYFGSEAVELPKHLESIVRQGRGHRSRSNDAFREDFIKWITTSSKTKPYKNKRKSDPYKLREIFEDCNFNDCAKCRKKEGYKDEAYSHIC